MLQALVNLLTNATRYGAGRIEVVTLCAGGELTFEVRDDGPGVDERFERVIWERFERGLHRLDAGIPGSGIGLSVVRGIARAHRGDAGYRRSERLGGSCFWVSVPGDSPCASAATWVTQAVAARPAEA
jgi:signal transduction histidine kinase